MLFFGTYFTVASVSALVIEQFHMSISTGGLKVERVVEISRIGCYVCVSDQTSTSRACSCLTVLSSSVVAHEYFSLLDDLKSQPRIVRQEFGQFVRSRGQGLILDRIAAPLPAAVNSPGCHNFIKKS